MVLSFLKKVWMVFTFNFEKAQADSLESYTEYLVEQKNNGMSFAELPSWKEWGSEQQRQERGVGIGDV